MSWNPITNNEIQPGKFMTQEFGQKLKDNFDYLYGKALYDAGILNGSFEIDADNDGNPDNWTKGLFGGGQGMYEDSIPAHGKRSFKFIHPGGANNGGGYLESDYYEVSEIRTYLIGFILWSTSAGMKNLVHIRFFDKDKNYIGTDHDTLYAASNEGNELIYRSVNNPVSATHIGRNFIPPTGARYVKIRLIAGYTDTDVAGSTFFDNITISPIINAIQTGTIVEGYTATTSYDNLGNVDVIVPSLASGILQLDFFADIKKVGFDPDTVYAKFMVGNYSSNEVNTISTTYIQYPFRLLVPHTEIVAGKINLKMYGKTEAGAVFVYVRKILPNISITVIPF
ncbi:MAG TPA: hypothetical protein ACFYEK_17730 [Candidatus Wunengus sp. YC60]|uniref:hypothetical protein n=1 Tax=Candidatus Wunengus sp. YC60 TaxID=3367697 RepID=UPI004029F51A